LAARTDKAVAVGVDDKRPNVVSGDNTPEWVGVVRSGVGIPYGVHTTSGKPLAVDFAVAIVNGLAANGIKATAVNLPVSSDGAQAVTLLSASKSDRMLLVTITQWETDKYFDSTLTYALRAEVRDTAGKLLATNSVDDSRNVGGALTIAAEEGSAGSAQEAIKRLLDDPKIVEALR